MSNVIELDRRPNAEMPSLVDRFIEASGARLCDQIIIAGASHLEHLISLTRRGFARVSCQSPGRGPDIPDGKADAILAPEIASEAQLLALVQYLRWALRPGGTVIIEAPKTSHLTEEKLRPALLAKGFTVEPASEGLWRVYRQDQALVRAA